MRVAASSRFAVPEFRRCGRLRVAGRMPGLGLRCRNERCAEAWRHVRSLRLHVWMLARHSSFAAHSDLLSHRGVVTKSHLAGWWPVRPCDCVSSLACARRCVCVCVCVRRCVRACVRAHARASVRVCLCLRLCLCLCLCECVRACECVSKPAENQKAHSCCQM